MFLHLAEASYPMKRRKFIFTAVAAATLVVVPAVRYRCRNSIPGDPLLRPGILARFCDKKEICEIGNHYLLHMPHESRKTKLVDLILTDKSGKKMEPSDESQLDDWIELKVRKDFEEQRTVIVDGWILSETEARQCALLSFTV